MEYWSIGGKSLFITPLLLCLILLPTYAETFDVKGLQPLSPYGVFSTFSGGELVGIYYAPDDEKFIVERLKELISAGVDILITTGGMSVDPDDVTRFAIRSLGATDIVYGSAVLPGAMLLVAYLEKAQSSELGIQSSEDSKLITQSSELIPILGIPACGMYHKTTIFDLILTRVLAGEKIGRRELAELGHGGLCLNCKECRFPICPFGKI